MDSQINIKRSMEWKEFETTFSVKLNQQQKEAVQSTKGPVLLLAVPGSGKTTVLVTRLGYMIYCRNIPPESILTVTYTVAATKDMSERFAVRFGEDMAKRLEFRTINGICAMIIQYYGRRIGKTPFELVKDEKATTGMLIKICQDHGMGYPTESDLKNVRTLITYIKNMMLNEEELQKLEEESDIRIAGIYREYCRQMREQKLMDYDDQMLYAYNILRKDPGVLAYFQNRYPYICVDEAQDTSKIQHAIIALLAAGTGNLFMVGDEDQSIYGFRAAYPDALMQFEQTYPKARVLLMEENYRSREPILAAANRFVARNRYRRPKTIAPTQGAGEPIRVVEVRRRADQLAFLFAEAQHCEVETAVLFRNHESALPIIDLCERRGVPYGCKAVEQTFFTNKIVRDVADIFALAVRPDDADTFLRCYFKFGVPVTRAQALYAAGQARQYGQGCWTALINEDSIRPRTRAAMAEVAAGLARLPRMAADDAVRFLTDQLGYGKYLDKNGMDRAKLAVLEMLGAQEPTPRRLLRRLPAMRFRFRPRCRARLSRSPSQKVTKLPKATSSS